MWSQPPDEVLLAIFSLLPQSSLLQTALVSQAWARVAASPSLWRNITLDGGAYVDYPGSLASAPTYCMALFSVGGGGVREVTVSPPWDRLLGGREGEVLARELTARCPNLTRLDLELSLSVAALQMLCNTYSSSLTSLRMTLAPTSLPLSSPLLASLLLLSSLHLSLRYIPTTYAELLRLAEWCQEETVISSLSTMPRLKRLILEGFQGGNPQVSRGLASLASVTCLALRGFTHIRGPDILLLGQSLQGLEYLEVDTMTDLTGEVALVLDRLEVELPGVTVARFTLLKI